MPWDPYFRYYFHLWQTFLHLRLRTFDFFKFQLRYFCYQAELHATLPLCAMFQTVDFSFEYLSCFAVKIYYSVQGPTPVLGFCAWAQRARLRRLLSPWASTGSQSIVPAYSSPRGKRRDSWKSVPKPWCHSWTADHPSPSQV